LYAAFDARQSAAKGYTHLLAGAKKNPVIAARLEARLKSDYPARYERCRIAEAVMASTLS
jgi:hypothetical protein